MNDYVLYIKTVQSQSIKILVESLKEVLTDINLYFDGNGLKIMTMDNARVALVTFASFSGVRSLANKWIAF